MAVSEQQNDTTSVKRSVASPRSPGTHRGLSSIQDKRSEVSPGTHQRGLSSIQDKTSHGSLYGSPLKIILKKLSEKEMSSSP